jgi:hypothetical protein
VTRIHPEAEAILSRITDEILVSDEFQQKLRELGPDKIRENIERGLAKLDQRAVAAARRAEAERSSGEGSK